jgi:RNA polymerase sigma-70 factor (ECF subfamily)
MSSTEISPREPHPLAPDGSVILLESFLLSVMSLEELIQACAQAGDAPAWEEFVSRFHQLIAAIVRRTADRWGNSSPALLDDLIQETYMKLCLNRERLVSEFTPQYPESFYGYLKVITANVVNDYFRSQYSHKRGKGQPQASIDGPGAQAPLAKTDGPESIQRNILLKEIDEALRCVLSESGLSEDQQKRDRTIFWLRHRNGLTAEAIARLPSISLSVKGVESVLHRYKCLITERVAYRRGPPGKV